MGDSDKYFDEGKRILENVVNENNRNYYFSRANLGTFLWLDCSVSNEFPGGPYWDEKDKRYFVPVEVNDYKINDLIIDKEKFEVKEGLSSGMNLVGIDGAIEKIKELILYENLHFNKNSRFEVLVNFLTRKNNKGYISLSRNQLDKIILEK